MKSIRINREDFQEKQSLINLLEEILQQPYLNRSFEFAMSQEAHLQFDFLAGVNYDTGFSDFQLHTYRGQGEIFLFAGKGKLKLESVEKLKEFFNTFRQDFVKKPSTLILDFQEVSSISYKARQVFDKLFLQPDIQEDFPQLYLIFHTNLLPYYSLKDKLTSLPNRYMVNGVDQAIQHIHSLNKPLVLEKSPKLKKPSLKSIDSYSKEELYDQLKQLKHTVFEAQKESAKEQKELLTYLTGHSTKKEKSLRKKVEQNKLGQGIQDIFIASSVLRNDIQALGENYQKLEKQLQERNHQLASKKASLVAILENTEDVIFSVDRNMRLTVANSASRKMAEELGMSQIPLGETFIQEVNTSLRSYWKPIFRKALKGSSHKCLFSYIINDKLRHFQCSVNPMNNKEGEVEGFSFFARDTTLMENQRLEAYRQQHLLLSISKNIQEGIFRTTRKDGIVYINQAFVELFGYDSVDEIQEVDLDSLYKSPARRHEFVDFMKEHTHFVNQEVEFRRKDGSTFWGLMSSTKVEDEHGGVFFDGAVRDITPLKEAKEILEQKNDELLKLNKELDRFVYSTSHDLRAPLVSMMGLITVMRLSKSPQEQELYLSHMETSIKKLENFIEDIIHYSQNARADVDIKQIDVKKMVEASFEHFKYAPNSPKIDMRVICRREGMLFSDPTRLNIILNNLISNAINYADLSKPDPFIRVEITYRKEEVSLCVKDNGIGIADHSKDRIFEMFYRGTKKSKGSGIGLYIVKETVDKLEGRITMESIEQVGTSFCIHLPNKKES